MNNFRKRKRHNRTGSESVDTNSNNQYSKSYTFKKTLTSKEVKFWGSVFTGIAGIVINDLSQPRSKIKYFARKILNAHPAPKPLKNSQKSEITSVNYKVISTEEEK